MLTSSQSPKDIRECYERHASCYVVKPFERQGIHARRETGGEFLEQPVPPFLEVTSTDSVPIDAQGLN